VADGKRPGNLKKAVEVIVDLVRGEGGAKGKLFPENFPLEEIVTIQSKMSCRRCCGTWMNGRRSSVSQITRNGLPHHWITVELSALSILLNLQLC